MTRSLPSSVKRVDERAGDLPQSLLPVDALPAARAPLAHALEWILEARRVVHALAVAATLLAAARVEVGHIRTGLRIVAGLLLPPHDAVLHVDVPGAVRLWPAVHEMRASPHSVPGPLGSIDVGPAGVLRERRRLSGGLSRGVAWPQLPHPERETRRARRRSLQEPSSIHSAHYGRIPLVECSARESTSLLTGRGSVPARASPSATKARRPASQEEPGMSRTSGYSVSYERSLAEIFPSWGM